MNYKEKIFNTLQEYMTDKSFKFFSEICKILPDCWNKPTSSTKKYHRKLNGEVPTNAEHTYHLVYATTKLLGMFNISKRTTDADKLLFAAALHDILKYGNFGTLKHTNNKHDKDVADMVSQNKSNFEKILSEDQFFVMEEALRFHSGRWSTDVPKNKVFDFKDYNPETLFIHILDMLSTNDLIQTDVRD